MDAQTKQIERRKGIGASQAAAVVGLSPWAGPLDVYRAIVEGYRIPNNPRMEWGLRHEAAILRACCERMDVEIREAETYQDKDLPFLFATPDGMMYDRDAVVEAKTTEVFNGQEWGEDGSDQIPNHYRIQVAQQMMVTGMAMAYVPVLIGLSDFRIFEIARDDGLEQTLRVSLDAFWNKHIKPRVPPIPDGSMAATAWVKERFPSDDGQFIQADLDQNAMLLDLEQARKHQEAAKNACAQLENQVKTLIATSSGIEGTNGRVTWKQSKGRISTDWRAVVEEAEVGAELIAKHTSKSTGSRRFCVPRAWLKE